MILDRPAVSSFLQKSRERLQVISGLCLLEKRKKETKWGQAQNEMGTRANGTVDSEVAF